MSRWWRVLRSVLLVLWLLTAVTAWWTAPREQTFDQARAAVSAGDVVAFRWGDSWRGGDGGPWYDGPTLRNDTGEPGPIVEWRTPSGRVYWARGTVQDFGAPHGTVAVAVPLIDGVGIALGVLALGMVLFGPAPMLGTRWFWWWLIFFAPYGLGLMFWLFRDRPWVAAPVGVGRRDRGWFGLVIGLLAQLLVGLALGLLHELLGDRWAPGATN